MLRQLAVFALFATTLATGYSQEEINGIGEPVSGQDNSSAPRSGRIQSLGVSSYTHGDPTAYEQLMLELINRARANPGAEVTRLGMNNLNQGISAGAITNTPKQPLAFHQAIIAAARDHSQWMLDTDTFDHTGANGSDAKDRMTAAGFPFVAPWGYGENLAYSGTGQNSTFDPTNYTYKLHEQLFKSTTGHRQNMMNASFDQVGVGILQGLFKQGLINYNTWMGTIDFGVTNGSPSPEGPFLVGVAYRDNNANNFYDPGEGIGGATVTLMPGDTTTTTSSSGGYAIPLGTTSGSVFVTFSGAAVGTSVTVPALVSPGTSAKADLVLTGTAVPPSQTKIIGLSGNLNFGSLVAGGSATRTLTISNSGKAPLVITGISHSDGAFTGNFAGTIAAGRKKNVTITFRPTAIQTYSGTLSVASNATSGTPTAAETGIGTAAPIAATPVISPAGGTFTKNIRVRITSATPRATIRYTLDGSEPTASSPKAPRNINLKYTATIKAKAFAAGHTESPSAEASFTKL
jgi:hypothetical protein